MGKILFNDDAVQAMIVEAQPAVPATDEFGGTMIDFKDKIPALFALARDRSEHARLGLAEMLADYMLSDSAALSLRESEMVDDLIGLLLADGHQSVRNTLAARFAQLDTMPRRIAFQVALGDIGTAERVLTDAAVLQDDDLIEIIGQTPPPRHAQAIARRARISEAVVDALVITGDSGVLQTVAQNLGAKLGPRALSALVEAARFSLALRQPVVERPEMNAEAALKLYWWAAQDLRRYILKRFGVSAGQIDDALAETLTLLLGDTASRNSSDAEMANIAEWLDAQDVLLPQMLPQLLRMRHFRLFAMIMAKMTVTTPAMIETVMQEAGGRGLATCARFLGMDKAAFVSMFLLSRAARQGEHVVHPRELAQALGAFDRMSTRAARDLLHSWKTTPGAFDAYRVDVLRSESEPA